MKTIAMIVFSLGFILYLGGMLPLYYRMYRRYGLYELFNCLVLFKYLNQHGKEAKPQMILVILGILCVATAGMYLRQYVP